MAAKYLYYTESIATGGLLSAAESVPWLEQFLYMYGGSRMCIHPSDADYKPTAPEHYPTLELAQEAYPQHKWIFLDAKTSQYLDEIALPNDGNIVFAAGHDLTGFGDSSFVGTRCQIRTLTPFVEGHALVMLCAAAADHWSRKH